MLITVETRHHSLVKRVHTHKVHCSETPMADLVQVAEDFFRVIFEKEVGRLWVFQSSLLRGRRHHELDRTSDVHVLLLVFIQQARHLPALSADRTEQIKD